MTILSFSPSPLRTATNGSFSSAPLILKEKLAGQRILFSELKKGAQAHLRNYICLGM